MTKPTGQERLPDHYFDLYKLAVDMADRISARRMLANSFFATVHTALIALLGDKSLPSYVSVAGVLLSLIWWALLKSYRDLNSAKFQVILEMEQRLPVKVFTDEWDALKNQAPSEEIRFAKMRQWMAQYRELGQVERFVPWMFAVLYLFQIFSQAWL